jgi:hypothetical protein
MSDTQSKLNAIESKIESLEDSLSAVRKVTPVHDSTWYVKWVAVFFICIAELLELRGGYGLDLNGMTVH